MTEISFYTKLIFSINLSGCIVLPPGVAKISRFEKMQWYDKSDTDISDLIIECFDRDKVVRNYILNNSYLNDQIPILHYSPSGSLRSWPNSQILWFFRTYTVFSYLTGQCFDPNEWCQKCYLQQLWIATMTNSRRCTVFLLGAYKVDQKTIFSMKWLNFANFRGSWSENGVLSRVGHYIQICL